jgi:hypothetical protein
MQMIAQLMQVFPPGIAALVTSKGSSGIEPTGCGWSIFCIEK